MGDIRNVGGFACAGVGLGGCVFVCLWLCMRVCLSLCCWGKGLYVRVHVCTCEKKILCALTTCLWVSPRRPNQYLEGQPSSLPFLILQDLPANQRAACLLRAVSLRVIDVRLSMMNDKSLFSEKSFRRLAFGRLQKIVSSALAEARRRRKEENEIKREILLFDHVKTMDFFFFSFLHFSLIVKLVSVNFLAVSVMAWNRPLSREQEIIRQRQGRPRATAQSLPTSSSQSSLLPNTRQVIAIPHSSVQQSSPFLTPVVNSYHSLLQSSSHHS